jgi:hypothetical protein
MCLFLIEEADFARSPFGAKISGEMEGAASPGGDCGGADGRVWLKAAEGEETGGFVEAEASAELACGGTEDSAAEGGIEGPEAVEFDGDGGVAGVCADGTAAPADGFAGKEQLGEEAGKFGLPASVFFAGDVGQVGEGLVEAGVVLAELWEELVADAVAGVGGVGVGGVFAPGLVGLRQVGLDLGAAGVEERAEDFAGALGRVLAVDENDRVDGAKAFGPCSAEELHEDSLGLIVEGMGGEDGVGVAGGDEVVEEVVTNGAGGLFDSLAGSGGAGGDVGLVDVERDFEASAEVCDEVLVGEGFSGGTDAVVDVDSGEADAEGVVFCGVGGVEGEEESDGVGSAGDGNRETVAGVDVGAVECEGEGRHRV